MHTVCHDKMDCMQKIGWKIGLLETISSKEFSSMDKFSNLQVNGQTVFAVFKCGLKHPGKLLLPLSGNSPGSCALRVLLSAWLRQLKTCSSRSRRATCPDPQVHKKKIWLRFLDLDHWNGRIRISGHPQPACDCSSLLAAKSFSRSSDPNCPTKGIASAGAAAAAGADGAAGASAVAARFAADFSLLLRLWFDTCK